MRQHFMAHGLKEQELWGAATVSIDALGIVVAAATTEPGTSLAHVLVKRLPQSCHVPKIACKALTRLITGSYATLRTTPQSLWLCLPLQKPLIFMASLIGDRPFSLFRFDAAVFRTTKHSLGWARLGAGVRGGGIEAAGSKTHDFSFIGICMT